jgi:hypothetical protein
MDSTHGDSPWGDGYRTLADKETKRTLRTLRTQLRQRSSNWYEDDDAKSPWQGADAFLKGIDSMATLMTVQAAIASLVLPYQEFGVVLAVNAAVAHRWDRLPAQERPLFLLAIRQLTQQQAVGPDLVAAALSVGSVPPLGEEAGLDRKAAEKAFGQPVAQLLVELQQMSLIEETIEYTVGGCQTFSCQISQGQVDLALSLFTGQEMQASSRSLLLFLMLKASEYRLVSSLGLAGASDQMLRSVALAFQVFSPLANRLGLGSAKDELEDSAFAIMNPDARAKLRQQLRQSSSGHLATRVDHKIEQALLEMSVRHPERFAGLRSFRVYSREKSAYSTWKKMKRKTLSFDEVWDKAGIRLILDAPDDKQAEKLCYIVRDLVVEMFPAVVRKEKDYIKHPKPNGYQSLQFITRWQDEFGSTQKPFEVQIRTEKMHHQAEYGSASHSEYKAAGTGSFVASTDAVDAGRDLFGQMDTNGDGQVTATELQAALIKLGVDVNLDQVKDMLKVFGTNQDGALEFQKFYSALLTTWFPLISGTHKPRMQPQAIIV